VVVEATNNAVEFGVEGGGGGGGKRRW